jgi:hypothetical protein
MTILEVFEIEFATGLQAEEMAPPHPIEQKQAV